MFLDKTFVDLLKKNKIIRYSRYTSSEAVSAERLNRTIRDLLVKPVFERGYANWVDVLTKKKRNNMKIEFFLLLD